MNNKIFWKRINIKSKDDCWEWQGCTNTHGYGICSINYIKQYVHRIAYELTHGEIPNGLCILHTCDNPSCCNPAHLFLGTQQDNINDKTNKGRQARGERNGRHKLTEEEVKEIRRLYSTGKYFQKELGNMFGVSFPQVSHIINNKQWRKI